MRRKGSKKGQRRIKLTTISQLLEMAAEADKMTSDARWYEDGDVSRDLGILIHHLDMAILFLPKTPQIDLVRRLAFAEAQRLRGSLLTFERVLKKVKSASLTDIGEAQQAGEIFNAALSVFRVMAAGL